MKKSRSKKAPATSRRTPQQIVEASRAALRKFAGTISGLPSDFASQHDHYIHNQPKQ